ncbi:MAG: homocysteine S-methyltransferase family protein, partial [Deltaproteobacteria bacterium]|nr:homocysteine S-methyltransferase family protein [Deltaproteobacteria bacterium]
MEEASRKDAIKRILASRPLIFDGAMGTEIQRRDPAKHDFNGCDGLNEILVETRPDIIREIHVSYLEAGCDAIETDSFGANAVVLAEYGIPERVYDLNLKAARLARDAADGFWARGGMKFVSGSVGPGTKLPSLGQIDFDSLEKTYIDQMLGLIDGGVDFIQIETSQDMLQIKAALSAARTAMEIRGRRPFLVCQATFEKTGKMLLGTDTLSFITAVSALDYVDFIGINCATGPADMYQVVEDICRFSGKMVSVLPNAGLPETDDGKIAYRLTPEEFARHMKRFVVDYGISIAGGCCGTTPEHIRKLAGELKQVRIKERVLEEIPACSSIFVSAPFDQVPKPLIVGERTNANGSREFREKLLNDDFEGMVGMGVSQGKEGAHILDLCVAYVGRNEAADMREAASRFARKIELPLMFDSTEAEVIEAALKRYGGRAVINSVNFEDGGKRFERMMSLAARFGAAVVGLTIDEDGMASTCGKKVEIARRIVNEARKFGLRESDLFIDALTFTLGSGDDGLRNAGIETLNAIRDIKKEFPGIFTLLGVSNISFGLSPESRQVLNSVFLHHAIEAGLDAAILNAKKILPLFKIPEEEQALARRLIFNEWPDGKNPLKAYIEYFGRSGILSAKSRRKDSPPTVGAESFPRMSPAQVLPTNDRDLLKNFVIEGRREGLDDLLDRLLKET